MTRLVVLVVLTIIAIAIAAVLQRRRPEPPTAPSYRAPTQVDRAEFAGRVDQALVVVFGSTTCSTCPAVWDVVAPLGSESVAVERIDIQTDPDRHQRYRIDGVPTTLVVDAEGVVAASFFGPVDEARLRTAIDGVAS